MHKFSTLAVAAAFAAVSATSALADNVRVKTRLNHLSGTTFVLVVSTLPDEITSITCDKWVMLGVNSWHDQNNFTIPAAGPNAVSLAILDANKFDGYCKEANSIQAHTDSGDFVGVLDSGPGNWTASTKLTFSVK